MGIVLNLTALALRQVADAAGIKGADLVIDFLTERFAAHHHLLLDALQKSNEQAWDMLEFSLAGDSLWDRCKTKFARTEDRAFRDRVRAFLDAAPLPGLPTSDPKFRERCLRELKGARRTGILAVAGLDQGELIRRTGEFAPFGDPQRLLQAEWQAVEGMADGLKEFPTLARFLKVRPPQGEPLLVMAVRYYFRREVETNEALHRGLTFDQLKTLGQAQGAGFEALGKLLTEDRQRLEELLDEVLTAAEEARDAAVAAHGAVLDLQAELQRLGGMHLANAEEVRTLLVQVQQHLSLAGMQRGEVRPQHSFSIRGEDERRAVKALLARFRQLPAGEQHQVPALLNGLGKLQVGAGDFAEARQVFEEVARTVPEAPAQAEARYNAYRTALEERKWDAALEALREAAALDSARFAPFPLHRYEPQRILGAGGFGTAILCHDGNFDEDVVVKTLHAADLERNLDDVFREARILRRLAHPAIIGVKDCEYADPTHKARPYIVMEYFPGDTLEQLVEQRGTLTVEQLLPVALGIVRGMQEAHRNGVWHRDLKPGNILVRQEGDGWHTRVIDFGLALRRQTIETSLAGRSAGNTILSDSVAGTLKYAPPEQMGEMRGVKLGPYSDVYAFGKTCCYALFKTTEPKRRQWGTLPEELADVLEGCIEQELKHRHPSFDPVLQVVEALDPAGRKADQRRKEEEAERRRQEAREQRQREEQERQRQELARLQQEGEVKLAGLVREALDRTRGKPTPEDTAAANEVVRQHRIPKERAEAVVREVRQRWQKERPREPQPGDLTTVSLGSGIDMKFAWIPAGTFLMGSPPGEESRDDDETQHRVTLTKGFRLGINPVTRGQFARFIQATGYTTQAECEGGAYFYTGSEWKLDPQMNWRNPGFDQKDDHPVVVVSWNDSVAFCEWLTTEQRKVGRFRLPTKAEWEYACRAGTTTPFHFGDTISTDQANYNGNYTYGKGKKGVYRKQTTPVGSFPANAWGLYDMHGNVLEWCQDWSGNYPKVDIKDPQGPDFGRVRVLRGGSWCGQPGICRSASCGGYGPGSRLGYCGCRVLLCLD